MYNLIKTIFKHFFQILLIFSIFFIFSCKSEIENKPKVENGEIDLSNWEFTKKGSLKLNGEWEFYWNKLLEPSDFINSNQQKEYIHVPNLWTKFKYENKPVGSYGYATYRIKIILPEKDKIYSLKIGRIETAYKIWIDDLLINEVGKVGNSRQNMRSAWIPTENDFFAINKEIYLTIQVSNFNHRKGGIANSIEIGEQKQIRNSSLVLLGFDIFLLGAILIMAFYHLGVFLLRKEDISPLFFFLAALSTAIYTTANGNFILSRIFSNINFELLVKINFISNYARIAFFTLFLGSLFKNEIKPLIVKIISYWAIAMAIVVIITPASFYSRTLLLLIIIALFTITYLSVGLIRATIRKRGGAIFSLIGTLCILFAAINDTLLDYGVINSIFMSSLGLFILIFFQSYMLSVRSAQAFKSAEIMTERLSVLDKIQKELLTIPSYDLTTTLSILHNSFNATNSKFYISDRTEKLKLCSAITDNNKNSSPKEDYYGDEITSEKEKIEISNGYNQIKITSPIFEKNKLKAVLFFEKEKSEEFDNKVIEVIKLLKSQIANIIDNALVYTELENLNKNLEQKVFERTEEVYRQKEEIENKNVEMSEMLEELKVTNEVIQFKNSELEKQKIEILEKHEELLQQQEEILSINEILERRQEEILNKNAELEKQKIEIIEKHEELLQQQEEILSINEILERRQEEILNKNAELEAQKKEISNKNEHITNSIEYAQRIQFALMKSDKKIPFKEHFILYKPRDIVSGDFYLVKKTSDFLIITVADCTGHGVPGAFMSMLGISLLTEVVNNHFRKLNQTKPSASLILDDLRDNLIRALSQKDAQDSNKDGMDIALCIIDLNTNLMQFAGAYNPSFIIRNKQLTVIEADKMPIGVYIKDIKPFKNNEFQLQENDSIYLFTDGYFDQFGTIERQKFLKKRFKNILLEINNLPMEEQLFYLDKTIVDWMGSLRQTDDILVMGFKISKNN